jgi:hypothetical protein
LLRRGAIPPPACTIHPLALMMRHGSGFSGTAQAHFFALSDHHRSCLVPSASTRGFGELTMRASRPFLFTFALASVALLVSACIPGNSDGGAIPTSSSTPAPESPSAGTFPASPTPGTETTDEPDTVWTTEELESVCLAYFDERVRTGISPDTGYVPNSPSQVDATLAADGVWDVLVPGTTDLGAPVGVIDSVVGCTVSGTPEAPILGPSRGL